MKIYSIIILINIFRISIAKKLKETHLPKTEEIANEINNSLFSNQKNLNNLPSNQINGKPYIYTLFSKTRPFSLKSNQTTNTNNKPKFPNLHVPDIPRNKNNIPNIPASPSIPKLSQNKKKETYKKTRETTDRSIINQNKNKEFLKKKISEINLNKKLKEFQEKEEEKIT